MSFFINKLNFSLIISILLYSFLAANICLFIALSYYKVFVFQSNEIKVRGKHIYKTIIAEHYNYSKWIIIGGIAFWGYSQGLYILSKKIEEPICVLIGPEGDFSPHEIEYALDHKNNFVKAEFLPEVISKSKLYTPSENAAEEKIKQRLKSMWDEKYGY